MQPLFLAALTMAATATIDDDAKTPAPLPAAAATTEKCDRLQTLPVDSPPAVTVRPLIKEPDANAYLAVHNTVDGCLEPILVNEYRAR